MKTIHTRHLLPLVAIALVAAACDPFPKKPGGDPRVVRVITTDQNWTAHSVTVENGGAAGTVVANQAFPLDQIYIQFNKPMNGLTLQKYADTDPAIPYDPATVGIRAHPADPGEPGATPPVPPIPAETDSTGRKFAACTVPTNLVLGGFEELPGVPGVWDFTTHDFQPGTALDPAYTSVCYTPSSPTHGGSIVITPAVALRAGVDYTVTGTVQDYEGKALPIDITVTVDPLPQASAVDGLAHPGYGVTYAYGVMVDWFPTGAASYTLETSTDGGTTWSASVSVPSSACVPATDFVDGSPVGYDVCEYTFAELPACSEAACAEYTYRVGDGAAPTTWRTIAAPVTARGELPISLTNFALTSAPSVLVEGAIQLAWGRVKGALDPAKPWVVERAPDDGTGAPGTWADITATLSTTAGTPRALTSGTRGAADLTALPAGTPFWYRVRPGYVSTVVRDGAPARKVSYKIPPP